MLIRVDDLFLLRGWLDGGAPDPCGLRGVPLLDLAPLPCCLILFARLLVIFGEVLVLCVVLGQEGVVFEAIRSIQAGALRRVPQLVRELTDLLHENVPLVVVPLPAAGVVIRFALLQPF